jgi:polysaccharide export outer membrane protein
LPANIPEAPDLAQNEKTCHFRGGTTWAAVLAVCLLLSACAGGADLAPPTEAEQKAIAEAAGPLLKLQAGEKIRLTVYGEASLSGDYQIDPSGVLSLPLAGPVKAAGLTEVQLKQEVIQKLRSEFLKNPKITISIIEFRPFYILGEVEKPGSYPYSSGLNALSAIAIAGGTTYRASKSSVLVQHPGESGLREYPITGSVPILPGDIIRVPARYF